MRSSAAARVTLSLAAALAALPRAVKGESAEPAWVTQPPPNTADSLYGVGEGPDLEDAKRNALKDAAGRLRVSLSSKTQRSVKDENGAVYSSALSEVLHEVQKTEFASAVLDRTAPSVHGTYALVKVDRRAFVKDTRARFEMALGLVDGATRDLDQKPPIEQYRVLQASLPNIRTVLGLGQLLREVDPAFGRESTLQPMAALDERASKTVGDLVFALEYGPGDADVARVVTAFVNGSGMRIAPTSDRPGTLVIAISTSSREQTIFHSKMVLLNVMLAVRNAQLTGLASRRYEVNGSSMSDYAAARASAVVQLGEALRRAGPVSGLGL